MSVAGKINADPRDILFAPVVSEKSYGQIGQNKYTFKVHQDAHKTQIRQAVEELFEVEVQNVNIVKVQPKPKRRVRARPFWHTRGSHRWLALFPSRSVASP